MLKGTSGTQTSPPRAPNTQSVTQTMENNSRQPNTGKGGRGRLHKIVRPDHNHNQVPVAVGPTQPQHPNPRT